MKKYLYVMGLFISASMFSQSKYSVEQVERSSDPQVIANFIKYNPDHPKTPQFKRKLFSAINSDKSPAQQAKVAKPSIKTNTVSKINSTRNLGASNQSKSGSNRTEDLLNHLFNTDPSSRSAYVQIVNKSKCNLIIKISGKKFYNLDVPANNQNYVLVEKGTYNLTTSVCDAKYSAKKNIGKDIVITLTSPK